MDLMPFHGPPAAAPRVPGFVARTLLGFGTHGEVWLADDLSTGGTVALKIGRRAPEAPAVASGDPPDQRSERETAVLCRINHPHIVRLQRVVRLPAGGLAMVLDLASGGSLASLVAARGRFDPGEVSTLLVPLADALDHLHRQGVVHGDIAPGNVLFTGEGRPQLGDLGAARVLGDRVENAWSTPGFTDPALTRPGPGGIDLRSADLWGLAAVGWFAFTGRPPDPAIVSGSATDGGLALRDDQTAVRGDRRAPALGELLMQCLTAAPADRPSLHELADRAWQAARPTPVRLVARDPEMSNPEKAVPVVDDSVDGCGPDGATADDLALFPVFNRVTRRVPLVSDDVLAVDRSGRWDDGDGGRGGGRGIGREAGQAAGFRGPPEGRRGNGVIALLAVGTAVAAVVVAVMVRYQTLEVGRGSPALAPGRPAISAGPIGDDASTSVRTTTVSTATVSTPTSGATPASEATAGLETELTQALIAIGRSRAAAFRSASASLLSDADVTGSPAYEADVRLVQRLRARGYRLHGVRYDVSEVQVLRRRGELVDVRAMVTTSKHRQIRVDSGAGISVPADGPRAVVLTVAPIDGNISGPTRWRVRSVQVPS